MSEVPTPFSEQGVQAELEGIRRDFVDRGDLAGAAAACQALIAAYPESKWLGNAMLLAAACYHQLGQIGDELATLQSFLQACPGHVQAPTVQRRVEVLQTEHALQNAASTHLEALTRLEQRLEQIETRLAALEQKAIPEAGLDPMELAHAFAQDMNSQVAEQRQQLEREITALQRRLGALRAPTWCSRGLSVVAVTALALSVLGLLGAYRRPLPAPTPRQAQIASRPLTAAPQPTVRITPQPRPAPGPASRTEPAPAPLTATPEHAPRQPAAKRSPGSPAPAAINASATAAPAQPAPTRTDGKPTPRPAENHALAPRLTPTSYQVKPGDTLWSISTRTLGSGRAVERIAAANGLTPPYNVRPGQTLIIPK